MNFGDRNRDPHLRTPKGMCWTGEEAIKQRFGARMRELRKARGLSQEAIAFACGLDRSYLGAVERGEKNVSLINIHRIAGALGVGARELFKN